jgi:hypothetical protein
MKKSKFLNILFIAFLFIFNSQSYGQNEYSGELCGTGIERNCGDLLNIPNKTLGEGKFLRALVIYVNFKWDDNLLDAYPYSVWAKPTQNDPNPKPINKYPAYTNGKLIWDEVGDKSKIMDRYPDYTISDYFCEMTMGQLDLIGDEYNIVLPELSTYYRDHGYNRQTLNAYVLNLLNNTYTIDWSRYDKWIRSGNNFTWGADGIAEMVIINYREIPNNESGWFWNSSWGGEASLELIKPKTFGSVTIGCDNGITALNMVQNTTHSEFLLEHEFAHKLFGYCFPGGDCHVNLGMMTVSNGASIYVMSPYERANPVVGYIQQPSVITQTGTYILGDFVETGQVLKVAIPETSDYYWIANHQKKSVYDGISRGSKTCYNLNFAEQDPYCSEGKGLYIYREGYNCNNFNHPYDVISSEGRYNWNIDQWVYVPYQNYHFHLACDLPTFLKTSGNRIYGRDNYQKAPNPSATGYGELIIDNICSDNVNDIFITWGIRGNGKNAFNVGQDEIFSPYSNPSTITSNNPNNIGLTIKLLSYNQSTGEIQLKIYYNDDALAISECAPSKPKNLKITQYYVDPGISFYAKLNWDSNIEPDFTNESNECKYKIYRGESANCDEEPVYYYLNSVSPSASEYIDNSVLIFTGAIGSYNCGNIKKTVSYKISAVDNNINESLKSDRAIIRGYFEGCYENNNDKFVLKNNIPSKFNLMQNYPNPFNPVANIKYDLPKDIFVTIKIFDINGREIKTLVNEFKNAGSHLISFNGTEFASGIYFYRIQAGDFIQVKKMLLIK